MRRSDGVRTGFWPDRLALGMFVLAAGPAALLAGYLGRLLVTDTDESSAPPFDWSVGTLAGTVSSSPPPSGRRNSRRPREWPVSRD